MRDVHEERFSLIHIFWQCMDLESLLVSPYVMLPSKPSTVYIKSSFVHLFISVNIPLFIWINQARFVVSLLHGEDCTFLQYWLIMRGISRQAEQLHYSQNKENTLKYSNESKIPPERTFHYFRWRVTEQTWQLTRVIKQAKSSNVRTRWFRGGGRGGELI